MRRHLYASTVIMAALTCAAQADSPIVKKVGVSVGSLGNPFYLATVNGVKAGIADSRVFGL